MRIRIWHGARGNKNETVEYVEFDGEEVGEIKEAAEKREKQTTVYRAADGRIVIHEVIRSRLQDEETARLCVFSSLDGARMGFGWVLETVGLLPSRRAMMGVFEGYD